MAALFLWLPWLLLSLLAICFLDLLIHVRLNLPPGPRPLPLIGSLHLLGKQPHRSLAHLAKTHGPLMYEEVVSSPKVAREFFQKHDAAFATRSVPDAVVNHGSTSVVWMPNSPRWRTLRKIMSTELFAPHRLDALHHLRREKVRELVDYIGRQASQGAAVKVGVVVRNRTAPAAVCRRRKRGRTSARTLERQWQEKRASLFGWPNVPPPFWYFLVYIATNSPGS
jgi:hypothetical protein